MRIHLVVVLISLAVVIFKISFSGLTQYISLDLFKQYRVDIASRVYAHYVPMALLYILSYIVVAAAALPFASLLTFVGGFLFGVVAGTVYTVVGATIGSVMLFLLVRYVIVDYVQQRYARKLERFNNELKHNGFFYLLSVRLFAIVPFFIINICAGLTPATVMQFIVTTAVGILPASVVFSYAGQQIMYVDTMHDIISWPVIISFVLLGLLALIPVGIKKVYKTF